MDNRSLWGRNTKLSGDSFRYYGVIDGKFDYFNIKDISQSKAKIITLPFPEKWYMICDKENREVANEWRKFMANRFRELELDNGDCLLSTAYDGSYYFGTNIEGVLGFDKFVKITFQQFLENIYKPFKAKQLNKMKIKPEQAQEIIDMISTSCGWKSRLVALWATLIVLKQEIEVSDELYKEGYKDASEAQKEVLDGIFGKGKEVKVPCINLGGFMCDRADREYKGISFYLSENYNWEIKKDSDDCLCLIQTNK